ncbi:MAG: fumarylacetoacetate hydrolase family protein [Oligoflexia bacterium]|nr:fumarylacetoacetate hydrolase family protein [Oligoflexia bacterium]
MILATRNNGRRDGELLVVSKDRARAARADAVAATLQAALDDWAATAPRLFELAASLERGECGRAFGLDARELLSPLPRAFAWLDGSAYLNHVALVRKARGAELPPTLLTDPLMYQGGSDAFLAPTEDIVAASEDWGIDFESEVAVVTGDVPMGVSVAEAAGLIRLILLCNDVSLRNLIPGELAKGFGFLQSKPSSAFAPLALTPEELGPAWRESRVHLPLVTRLNGELFGNPDAGPEMHFSFAELIAHAARTRPLRAGTIVGSGTVSNEDRGRGSSCLAEKRMLEVLDSGTARTPFLRFGDRVRIEMFSDGVSLFGAIDQRVSRPGPR